MKFCGGIGLPKDQVIRFWWLSGFFRGGSWIIFQDSLPLADRAQIDILQCSSANYRQISTTCFGEVEQPNNPYSAPIFQTYRNVLVIARWQHHDGSTTVQGQ